MWLLLDAPPGSLAPIFFFVPFVCVCVRESARARVPARARCDVMEWLLYMDTWTSEEKHGHETMVSSSRRSGSRAGSHRLQLDRRGQAGWGARRNPVSAVGLEGVTGGGVMVLVVILA